MILAAGLSPAWQQILVLDSMTPGAVNRAAAAHWCASGKVLNAGLALHHLGGPNKTLSLVGGSSGQEIRREFAELGLDARWVETETRTRICTTVLDTSAGATTELVEECLPVSQSELSAFRQAYAEEAASADVVILIGSLPGEVPTTIFRDLLAHTSGRAILDFRGPALLEALSERPFLVKPNRDELSRTVGRSLAKSDELLTAMHEINDRGAEWVVVTDGPGDVHASSKGQAYRFRPLAVEVVNPIACGDCLAAGIAWALHAGAAPLLAIRTGLAAAADNVSQLLPGRLDPTRVEARMREIQYSLA